MTFLLFSLSFAVKLLFVIVCLLLIVTYNWKRRWVYYYSWKFPGPFSVPLVGTVQVAFAGQKGVFEIFGKLIRTYPNIFRMWFGNQLCIVTSRPQDVEVLLNTCLQKENFMFYEFIEDNLSSIFSSTVDTWKVHRKMINPSFNSKIIHSYNDIFSKYANMLNDEFGKQCGKNIDVLPVVWKCTLDTLFETLANVEPGVIMKNTEVLIRIPIRYEELITERLFNVILHLNFFWRLSPYSKELKSVVKEACGYMNQVVEFHQNSKCLTIESEEDAFKDKMFMNQLLSKNLTRKEVLEETVFMFMAGSETAAITTSSVLLAMSIYQDVQEKVYEEQCSIFKDNRDADLNDINQMHYLERVIKETMRLLPPAPYVARYVDKDVDVGSHVIPAGSSTLIPIWYIHKNPEFWPDPLKFDPDRFLPEEVEKRPRTSYIPFSYGPRNCIGWKYGMMSMKVILSTILREFRVRRGKYNSLEEVDIEFCFVGKAKDGYNVTLERRI